MCIGIWTLDHPHYALILGTNRDEFLHRPTQNAHFHAFGVDNAPPSVLSGRDEQAGGSWFGINRAGRVALLTNITELPKKYTTSRGSLVSSFLLSESTHPLLQPNDGDPKNNNKREGPDDDGIDESESRQQEQQPQQDPHQLLWEIIPKDAQFAGFNLLLLEPSVEEAEDEASKAQEGHNTQKDGSRRRVRYTPLFVTNHGGGGQVVARPLTPNEQLCGGMSNGIDGQGAELWPKVQHATHDFDTALRRIQRLVQVQVESRVQNQQDLGPRTRTLTEIEVSPTDEPTTDAETEAELVDAVFNLLSWHPPKKISTRAELRETVQVHPIRITLSDVVSNNAGRPQPSASDSPSSEAPPPDEPTTPAPSPPSANLQPSTTSGATTPSVHLPPPPPPDLLSSPTGSELSGRPDVTENQSGNMTPTPPAPGRTAPKPSSSSGTAATPTPAYYATRLSTVLLVSRQGEVTFIERDIWELPLESDAFGKGEGHGMNRSDGGSGLDPNTSSTLSSPTPSESTQNPSPTPTSAVTITVTGRETADDAKLTMSSTVTSSTLPASADSNNNIDNGNSNGSDNEKTEQRFKSTKENTELPDLDRAHGHGHGHARVSGGEAIPYRSDPPRERKFRFNLDLDSVKAC